MTAHLTTAAADLARGIARLDPDERLQVAATVFRLLADALDDGQYGTDVSCSLLDAASDAEANLRDLREFVANEKANATMRRRKA
jgi:hypothetical protein